MSVLCLIANPAEPALDAALVARDPARDRWRDQLAAPAHRLRDRQAEAGDPLPMPPAHIVAGKPIDVALVPSPTAASAC